MIRRPTHLLAALVLLFGLPLAAAAQTITRVVTSDGKVIYTDHPELVADPAVQSRRDLSEAQLSGTNALNAVGADPTLRACQADSNRYCFSARGEQHLECLVEHQKQLSNACFSALRRKTSGKPGSNDPRDNADAPLAAGTRQACATDLHQYCSNVGTGGGYQLDCLLDHQKDISDACYDNVSGLMRQP